MRSVMSRGRQGDVSMLFLALALASAPACKGAAPAANDGAAKSDQTPPPTPEAPTPPATDAAAVEPPSPSEPETSTKPATPEEPAAAEPPTAAPPGPPPEFAALPTDPAIDPMRVLLGGQWPETVEILDTYEHGKRRIVLYRIDLAARWLATRPADDPLVEAIEEAQAKCDEEADGISEIYACLAEAPKRPGVPPELVAHLAHDDAFAWEIAEVELSTDGKGLSEGPRSPADAVPSREGRVLQQKRLLDFGLALNSVEAEREDLSEEGLFKFKVYDMDGDKRSEILVVFPLTMPVEDMYEQNMAAVGFLLDRTDFHIQFATTRFHEWDWSDVSSISDKVETTWQTKDENGDGHADLLVRERNDYSRDDSEEDEDPTAKSDKKSTRSTVCLWERDGDRWVCPESLGTKIIDGAKLVERTGVPLPEPAPAEAPAGEAPAKPPTAP